MRTIPSGGSAASVSCGGHWEPSSRYGIVDAQDRVDWPSGWISACPVEPPCQPSAFAKVAGLDAARVEVAGVGAEARQELVHALERARGRVRSGGAYPELELAAGLEERAASLVAGALLHVDELGRADRQRDPPGDEAPGVRRRELGDPDVDGGVAGVHLAAGDAPVPTPRDVRVQAEAVDRVAASGHDRFGPVGRELKRRQRLVQLVEAAVGRGIVAAEDRGHAEALAAASEVTRGLPQVAARAAGTEVGCLEMRRPDVQVGGRPEVTNVEVHAVDPDGLLGELSVVRVVRLDREGRGVEDGVAGGADENAARPAVRQVDGDAVGAQRFGAAVRGGWLDIGRASAAGEDEDDEARRGAWHALSYGRDGCRGPLRKLRRWSRSRSSTCRRPSCAPRREPCASEERGH